MIDTETLRGIGYEQVSFDDRQLCEDAADEIEKLRFDFKQARQALRLIKYEALVAGSSGQRTSAKAFAHITRLCIDVGISEKLHELRPKELTND